MEKLNLFQILIPAGIGFLAIFVYSQIAARKELELRKKGYKPTDYQNKLPQEYTKKESRFTLLIIVFLLSTVLFALYFLLNRKSMIAEFIIILGVIIWRFLIKLGNKVNKT